MPDVFDARVGAAQHEVFACAFQIIVHDQVGSRARPAADRLRVRAHLLEVLEVGVDHGRGGGVQREPPPRAFSCVALEVRAVEHDLTGHVRDAGRIAAEIDQRRHVAGRREMDADQSNVVCTRRRAQSGVVGVAREQRGHEARVLGSHALSLRGQLRVLAGADDQRARAREVRQREWSLEARAGLELDHVTRGRCIERGLKIVARGHQLRRARGRRQRDLHARLRQCLAQLRVGCDVRRAASARRAAAGTAAAGSAARPGNAAGIVRRARSEQQTRAHGHDQSSHLHSLSADPRSCIRVGACPKPRHSAASGSASV